MWFKIVRASSRFDLDDISSSHDEKLFAESVPSLEAGVDGDMWTLASLALRRFSFISAGVVAGSVALDSVEPMVVVLVDT